MDRQQQGNSNLYRVHNPNHPPRQAPPYPPYVRPTVQPPLRQPAFDPFHRRDPFMPAPQTEKRDGLLSNNAWRGTSTAPRAPESQHKDTLQPAPAPPPSPFHSGYTAMFRNDHDRRRSIGAGFPAGPVEPPAPPPIPPSFISRHMPPPSSSPHQSPTSSFPHPIGRSSLPTPPSFAGSRETPANSTGHRPSSNMSIQSIMSSEPPDTSKASSWSPFGTRDAPAGRPRTPEKRPEDHPFRRSETGGSVMKSPILHSSTQTGSPEQSRPTLSRLMQPFPIMSPVGLPPRPFSQPVGADAPGRDQRLRTGFGTASSDPSFDFADRPVRDHGSGMEHQRVGFAEDKTLRDRPFSDLAGTRTLSYAPPYSNEPLLRGTTGLAYQNDKTPGQPREPWPSPRQTDNRPDMVLPNFVPTSKSPGPGLSSFHHYGPSQIYPQPFGSNFGPGHIRSEHQGDSRPPLSTPGESRLNPSGTSLNRLSSSYNSKPIILDQYLGKSLEESQLHNKSFLGFGIETNRRMERASPLPQAVQGASAQPAGSARDPSIKSEFARMFSGLGSGVGSTPQPVPPLSNEAVSAGRSPATEDGEGEPGQRVSDGVAGLGVASRGGRRGKRVRDEDANSESGEGRSTPIPSIRGGKRNKLHHHHHHPYSHHHHHHHQTDEDLVGPHNGRRSTSTPLNPFKFPAAGKNLPPVVAVAGAHHHHHHHPPLHHHHHPAKATLAQPTEPIQPLRRPVTTIKTRPLLESISHLPQHHLGSCLYAPHVGLPSSTSTSLDSKHTFASSPNLLPLSRLVGNENCTITIRIPRFYLTDQSREDICAEKRVWGTDVYTDDSDPLAAAIHSGWILGAWSADVDVSLLDLDTASRPTLATSNRAADLENARCLTSPPTTGPVAPPDKKDLHLTLLVLPALEAYASSVWHGVKSRAWGGNHDGMSFKVEKVEWVNEGLEGRCEERDGKAKKSRLRSWEGVGMMTGVRTVRTKKANGLGASVGRYGKVGAG